MIIRWLHNGYTVVFLHLQGIRQAAHIAGKSAGGEILIIYQMFDNINRKEYDAVGELFRRRLENHRTPVDGNGWDEIERRMGKRKKNKAAIWLWSAGAMAAAAAVAALVILNNPATGEVSVMNVSQQVTPGEAAAPGTEPASPAPASHKKDMPHTGAAKPASNNTSAVLPGTDGASSEAGAVGLPEASEPGYTVARDGLPVATAETGPEQPGADKPAVAQAGKEMPELDISLVEDRPDEEAEGAPEEKKGWLLAAALGTGGYTDGFRDTYEDYGKSMSHSPGLSLAGSNDYAADKSGNITSFNNMNRESFTGISHSPPLSVGITVRKSLGQHGGVETGLVYTYLSSRFEWSGYDVHQSLHYIGIPVNMAVYLWQTGTNWRIYLSAGFMVEKGVRGIYRQEDRQRGNEIRTTTVRSSIDGLQWSLNGGLGINYRFNRGLGICFEPRVGYAFDCDQPVSMRTEWPVFIGINMGLNYEF
jgi:hypothetical protein